MMKFEEGDTTRSRPAVIDEAADSVYPLLLTHVTRSSRHGTAGSGVVSVLMWVRLVAPW